MNPFELVHDFVENLVRNVVIVGLIVAAIVGAYLHLTRAPGGAEQMQKANPGWTVTAMDGAPVIADDASGRGEVMLHPDDLGPHRIERVDCAEVRAAFPKWFMLPDAPAGNCLRLHDATPPTLVLNVRSPMRITQLWDRQYAPLLDRLKLVYGGGRSGRFASPEETDGPAGKDLAPESGVLSYSIDPAAGSGERIVSLAAWGRAGTTRLVFTFRQAPRT